MLGGILGYAELIKLQVTDEKLKKYINGIIAATNSAASLTEKLLTYSRQAENLLTTVSIHKSISTALDILERTIDKKILISKNLKAIPDIIIGDPAQLENLFLNLGLNARDAMEQGEFSIKTESVILSKNECNALPFTLVAGEYIKITISDTGSGIPVNIQEKIFEPFFTTKEVGKGTGLGLAAVYGAVKEHKGAILLDSMIGTGTIFTIYLPVAQEQNKILDEPNNLKQQRGNREHKTSILIVDDEMVIQDTLQNLLEAWNYSVVTACNGEEAIKIYRETPTNLVILDIIMPKMGGEECFYKLKEIDPNVKVILSSGFTKNASINKLLENGVLDFIKKPFHYDSLQKILEKNI
jgi:CheY-like chemotaxis protein